MASKFTIHNGLESNSVNSPINVTTGLEVGGLSFPSLAGKAWYVDAASTAGSGADGVTKATGFTTIAAALTAASADDTIFVYPGTYAENLSVTKDNITLVAPRTWGNSKRVIVEPASGVALTLTQVKRFAARGIRFSGVSGVGCLSDGEGSLFVDCDFASDTSHGIKFLAETDTDFTGSGTHFERCLFRGCGGAGIQVAAGTGVALGLQATNVNVRDCQFYENTDDDVNDSGGDGTNTFYSQWCIENCKFMTRNKTTYLDLNGGSGSTELVVANCYFAVDAGLTSTHVQLPAGGVAVALYDAAGIVNTSTF